jgi:hypothetical protein
LRASDVIQFVKQQAVSLRAQFAADLATLSASIGVIENAQLADIASRLDALSGALKDGIKDLQESLDALDRTIDVFTSIEGSRFSRGLMSGWVVPRIRLLPLSA